MFKFTDEDFYTNFALAARADEVILKNDAKNFKIIKPFLRVSHDVLNIIEEYVLVDNKINVEKFRKKYNVVYFGNSLKDLF